MTAPTLKPQTLNKSIPFQNLKSSNPQTPMTRIRILLFDTETNGLPKNRFAPATEFREFPAILQLSWGVYDVKEAKESPPVLHCRGTRDIHVLLHPSVPWDADAAKIHGLTEAECRDPSRTPDTDALVEFANAIRSVNWVVAHNLGFDKSILRAAGFAAASRLSADDGHLGSLLRSLWPRGPPLTREICTMSDTRDVLRIPAPEKQAKFASLNPFKSPRLGELYVWLFHEQFDGPAHSASSDVDCLELCFSELLRRGFYILEV